MMPKWIYVNGPIEKILYLSKLIWPGKVIWNYGFWVNSEERWIYGNQNDTLILHMKI
jgi:hypothetical protein